MVYRWRCRFDFCSPAYLWCGSCRGKIISILIIYFMLNISVILSKKYKMQPINYIGSYVFTVADSGCSGNGISGSFELLVVCDLPLYVCWWSMRPIIICISVLQIYT